MSEKNPNIVLYLEDLTQLVSKLSPQLEKFISFDHSQSIDKNIIIEPIQLIRDLSMIFWMGGNQLQIEFINDFDFFINLITDILINENVPTQIKIELLKLIETLIRANLTATKILMDQSKNLKNNLQILFTQNSQTEFDQQIKRWILKLLYIYQIHKHEINNWQDVNYSKLRKIYSDLYPT